jgi:hypothetical protein
MSHAKYPAYLAIICAVLLDLYSSNPDTSANIGRALDAIALIFAMAGLCGLAIGHLRTRRS